MILDDIKEKLKEIDENVFYGMVDSSMQKTVWDYIVFNRSVMRVNANKTGYTDVYTVTIVREEWIPEGLEGQVIEKMKEIPGMRIADNDAQYTYVPKPNTNVVVETLSIDFLKPKKV